MERGSQTFYFLIWVALYLAIGSPFAQAVTVQSTDPGDPGSFAVTRAEYDFGDTAFTPVDFPAAVEVIASVHYPTDLTSGPFPLVVFMHGRHATCFEGSSAFLQWPCVTPRQPIPSYQGYDYIAETLASHGYIVVSVGANGINASDNFTADLGMFARAQLIQHHLSIWDTFNTAGSPPFGTIFVGKVDLDNVGTMGHSRGGEGVVRHFVLNQDEGSPYGIRAVFPLAPTDFSRFVINNVPLAVTLPYCDGDVADLQGMHFFDDALYNVPGDTATKHTVVVMGANHNFFNTIWTPSIFAPGSVDDWLEYRDPTDPHCGSVSGNRRLTDAEQRGTGLAYITAFFRTFLGGESEFAQLLTGDEPPPPSAMTDELFVSFHAPDIPDVRRDLNRLLDDTNLTVNTLGGAVTQLGLTPYDLCGGELPQPQHCLSPAQPTNRQPHTVVSFLAPTMRGLSQLRFGWDNTTANYINELPDGLRDVREYFALQFRVSVNFDDGRNPVGLPQDFSVTLIDGSGNTATIPVSDSSDALFYPPGSFSAVPKVILNTVRMPLVSFTDVDLTDVRSIQFSFDQEPQGALLISDIAFADVFPNASPVADAGPDQTVECTGPGGTQVTLDGSASTDADGDMLIYTWTGPFGTASGATPTVTLPLGVHTITLTVDDGKGGLDSDEVVINVQDTLPPDITDASVTPDVLWPPNHKMVPVTVAVPAADACDVAPVCQIVSVSSNEAVNGLGDGNTAPDWEISGDLTLNLRAERSGRGNGRVYSITLQCTDAAGNSSMGTVTATVPHDQGN